MDTPALDQLMGAYFHQDWDLDGTEWAVVEEFLTDEPDLAADLPTEIDRVLTTVRDEGDLERLLDAKGCSYWADPARGGYRQWLTEIAAHARRASASEEP